MHEARSKDELYRKIYHEPEGNIGVLRVELMYSLFFANNSSPIMKGVIFMAKEYIVKATKYGRDWKKIGEGIDFLEDNKKYRLEFHATGLIQAIRVKIAFKQNKRFKYYNY